MSVEGIKLPLRGWMYSIKENCYIDSRHAIGLAVKGKFRVILKLSPVEADNKAVGVFVKINGKTHRIGYLPGSRRPDSNGERKKIYTAIEKKGALFGHLEYWDNHPDHNDFCMVVAGKPAKVTEPPDEDNIIINALNRIFDNNSGKENTDIANAPDNIGEEAKAFEETIGD